MSTAPSNVEPATAKLIAALVAKSTNEEIRSLLADGAIDKSLGESTVRTHQTISDQWSNGPMDKIAPADVPTGAPLAASGGNAYRQTQMYSDNAPQSGMTALAGELGASLARMESMVKSLTHENSIIKAVLLRVVDENASIAKSIELLKAAPTVAAPTVAAKAEDDKEEKKKMDDEDEKCASMLDTAHAVFKAGVSDGDLGKVMRALSLAKSLTGEFPKAPRPAALLKSIEAFAASLTKSDDQGEWPADKKGKKDDEDEKAAAKAASIGLNSEQQAMLKSAVDGNGVINMRLNQLFDILGKSVPAAGVRAVTPPAVFKAVDRNSVVEKAAAISDMEDEGRFSPEAARSARTALSLSKAVSEGALTEDILHKHLATAPKSVQDFFAAAA
jgi:regulator of replication initiation timing